MSASAKVFVICCIDPRFRHHVQQFIETRYDVKPDEYDLQTYPGGIRAIADQSAAGEALQVSVGIGVKIHGVEIVVTINHMDCAYYADVSTDGDSSRERQQHERDLMRSARQIRRNHNNVPVDAYIVQLDGDTCEFRQINVSALAAA